MDGRGRLVQVRRSTGTSDRQEAEKRLAEFLSGGGASRPLRFKVTVADAVEAYFKVRDCGPSSRVYLDRFVRLWGHVPVGELNVGELHVWARGLGLKDSSWRRQLGSLRTAFAAARRAGLAVPEVDLMLPFEGDHRRRFLSEAEEERLLGACDARLAALVWFLLRTGARVGEALALTWDGVVERPGGGRAVLLTSRKGRAKKARTRRVPLHESVELGGRGAAQERVFGETYRAVKQRFERVRRKVGLEDVTLHDLRRTFASRLLQRGAHPKAVAELLGHSTAELLDIYGHLIESDLDRTVGMLG